MLHSALLQAVYKITDTVPGPEDIFGSRSAIDLRNGWMPPPYNEKRQYVNSAIVIQRIEVPCLLFSQENGFWEASKYIAKLWEAVRERKGMVATIESEAAAFLGAIKQQSDANKRASMASTDQQLDVLTGAVEDRLSTSDALVDAARISNFDTLSKLREDQQVRIAKNQALFDVTKNVAQFAGTQAAGNIGSGSGSPFRRRVSAYENDQAGHYDTGFFGLRKKRK